MLPQNELHIKITVLEFSRTVDVNIMVGNTYNKANHFYINATAYPITLIVPFGV